MIHQFEKKTIQIIRLGTFLYYNVNFPYSILKPIDSYYYVVNTIYCRKLFCFDD